MTAKWGCEKQRNLGESKGVCALEKSRRYRRRTRTRRREVRSEEEKKKKREKKSDGESRTKPPAGARFRSIIVVKAQKLGPNPVPL